MYRDTTSRRRRGVATYAGSEPDSRKGTPHSKGHARGREEGEISDPSAFWKKVNTNSTARGDGGIF